MAMLRLEIGVDIRDGKDHEADLLRFGEMADPEAEQSKEIEEEEDRAVLEMRLRQAWLDREWAEVTLKVEELEEREKQAVCDTLELEHLADRIRLAGAGNREELSNLAKSWSKVRIPAKKFTQCEACIWTPFDRKVQWKVCVGCNKKYHLMWQLESVGDGEEEVVINAAMPLVSRTCRGKTTFLDLLTQVEMEVERLKERGKEVYKLPAGAKVEIGQKRGEVEEEHCQLLDRLLVQIGAARQQYHGGAFIGRHVDKVLENAEMLAEVLEDGSEAKLGFLEFAVIYRRIHFLLKARRQLNEEEICELEIKCAKLG